jgi:tetratricopeptide (TPR) repeat protein
LWDRSKTFSKEYDTWDWEDVLLIETAILTENKKAADYLLKRLSKNANPINTVLTSCAGRHLGAAANMLGRQKEALDYYHEALKVATNTQFRPEIALIRFQLAELLHEHYPEKREDMLEHLDFAIEEFKEMKMAPSFKKALTVKKKIEKL